MACNHVGAEFVAETLGENHGVEEYRGLGDACLLELFVSAGKHYVGDAETKDFVGTFKKLVRNGVVVVKIFAHADKLCALAGKNKCFLHCDVMYH